MFDGHRHRQHRLNYFVRGPEWAFAVPQGDLDALEDVMRRCSGFWNGVGSLVVPVRANGNISQLIDNLVEIRGVDQCFVHESLREQAARAVQQRFGTATRLWQGFDEHEVHPLHLLGGRPPADARKSRMEIPSFGTAALQRIALAVWGDASAEDLAHWRDYYDVSIAAGAEAYGALLRGQIAETSPLQLSARGMNLIHQKGPLTWHPFVWVLENASFNTLVAFWNFRARLLWHGHRPWVVGLPAAGLRHPEQLSVLADWTPRIPGQQLIPDTFVVCQQRRDDEVRSALAAVPFVEETETRYREQTGRDVEPNNPRTFAFMRPLLSGPFARGTRASALVSFNDGVAALSLPSPEGFAVRNFAYCRLVLANLPLPLPLTASAARAVHDNAMASDGVLILTAATAEWNLDVRLPSAAEALRHWATDHGFTVTYTQDGRDADALLRRLGSIEALDTIADIKRLALLRTLAPTSRVKFSRRLVAEASEGGVALDEVVVADRLADIGLFLEVEARTAADIATAMGSGTRKRDVLELLPPLVSAGFVRRARDVRCPQCRFRMLLDLADQDEVVRCRACRETFVLPVLDESGQKEPDTFYRLDGLMARAMDQDVLPVLLTLRAVRPPPGQADLFFAWPGVEFSRCGRAVDVDLLVSDGSAVWCWEAKNNAAGLKSSQLRKVTTLAAQLGARPALAAVEGVFDAEQAERVTSAGGRVLAGAQLFV